MDTTEIEETLAYVQLTLKNIRLMPYDREDVKAFIRDTSDIPEDAIVVVKPTSVSLLTDADGYPLSFR